MLPKLARVAGAAAVSMAVLLVPAGLALAEDPPVSVQIASTAYLQPDGSALLSITYNCFPGLGGPSNGSTNGTLEQAQALGVAADTPICDDRIHTTTLQFRPGPFTAGEAAAKVTVSAGANESASAQAEVHIT